MEREAADVGVRSRPRQHPCVGRDAHRRSSHVDVNRRRRHRWQLLSWPRRPRRAASSSAVWRGDLVLEDVDRDPDRVGCRGGSRLELLPRHGVGGVVGLLEVAPRAAVLVTAAAGNTRDSLQERLERDPAVRLELLDGRRRRPRRWCDSRCRAPRSCLPVSAWPPVLAGRWRAARPLGSGPLSSTGPLRPLSDRPPARPSPERPARGVRGRHGSPRRRTFPGDFFKAAPGARASSTLHANSTQPPRTRLVLGAGRSRPPPLPTSPARDEVIDGDGRAGGGAVSSLASSAAPPRAARPCRRRPLMRASGSSALQLQLRRSSSAAAIIDCSPCDVVGRPPDRPLANAAARARAARAGAPPDSRPSRPSRGESRGEANRPRCGERAGVVPRARASASPGSSPRVESKLCDDRRLEVCGTVIGRSGALRPPGARQQTPRELGQVGRSADRCSAEDPLPREESGIRGRTARNGSTEPYSPAPMVPGRRG